MFRQIKIRGWVFNLVDNIKEKDCVLFLEIIKTSFQKMSDEGQNSSPSRYTIEDFRQKILAAHYYAIYTHDDKPVAIASYELVLESKCAHMIVCAVDPKFQTFGFGTILFNESFESACRNGCYYAISDTSELN